MVERGRGERILAANDQAQPACRTNLSILLCSRVLLTSRVRLVRSRRDEEPSNVGRKGNASKLLPWKEGGTALSARDRIS